MEKPGEIAPVLQKKFLIYVLCIISPHIQLFDNLVIGFQDTLKTGPVGAILPAFIFVRICIGTFFQDRFPVSGIVKEGSQKIIIPLFQKMGIVIIISRIEFQNIGMKQPVIVTAVCSICHLDDPPQRENRRRAEISLDKVLNSRFERRFQKKGFIHRFRRDNICMLQGMFSLPKEKTCCPGMNTVGLPAAADSGT